MPDEEVLELDTRRRIYARVVDEPGVYLRELQRALGMPVAMLEYHLGKLEDAKLVTVLRDDHKRYFPAQMDATDKRYLALLRHEACRGVVMHLLARPGATRKELVESTALLPSTLSYYLAKLVEAGMATRAKEGRLSRYALVGPERALALVARYRPSLLDRVLDRVMAGLDEVRPPR
jgi:predicted transcriptional regulator